MNVLIVVLLILMASLTGCNDSHLDVKRGCYKGVIIALKELDKAGMQLPADANMVAVGDAMANQCEEYSK